MPCSSPSPAEALRSIAILLDTAAEAEGWFQPARLVRVDALPHEPDEDGQLAFRTLPPGVHPLAALDGAVVEPGTVGLGVVAEGESFSTESGEPSGRVRVVELLLRDGTRATGLRKSGGPFDVEVRGLGSPCDGAIPLAMCRVLGVPVVGGRMAGAGAGPGGA